MHWNYVIKEVFLLTVITVKIVNILPISRSDEEKPLQSIDRKLIHYWEAMTSRMEHGGCLMESTRQLHAETNEFLLNEQYCQAKHPNSGTSAKKTSDAEWQSALNSTAAEV